MSEFKISSSKNYFLNIISLFLFCAFALVSINTNAANTKVANDKGDKLPNHQIDRPEKAGSQNMSDLQFLGADAFNQMEEASSQMNRSISQHRKIVKKILQDAEIKRYESEGDCSSLVLDQDRRSYIYDLQFNLVDKNDVKIIVFNRILRISADYPDADDKQSKGDLASKKFKYFLPLPYDAQDKPKISRQEGRIIIKFDKVQK